MSNKQIDVDVAVIDLDDMTRVERMMVKAVLEERPRIVINGLRFIDFASTAVARVVDFDEDRNIIVDPKTSKERAEKAHRAMRQGLEEIEKDDAVDSDTKGLDIMRMFGVATEQMIIAARNKDLDELERWGDKATKQVDRFMDYAADLKERNENDDPTLKEGERNGSMAASVIYGDKEVEVSLKMLIDLVENIDPDLKDIIGMLMDGTINSTQAAALTLIRDIGKIPTSTESWEEARAEIDRVKQSIHNIPGEPSMDLKNHLWFAAEHLDKAMDAKYNGSAPDCVKDEIDGMAKSLMSIIDAMDEI